jgi:hypothetical protein
MVTSPTGTRVVLVPGGRYRGLVRTSDKMEGTGSTLTKIIGNLRIDAALLGHR